MNRDAETDEKALIALAAPLVWHWFANDGRNGEPVTSSRAGQHWWAVHDGVRYTVHQPLCAPGEVDASVREAWWNVRTHDGVAENRAWVASQEEAKDVCLRFALTGDKSEMKSLDAAATALTRWFNSQETAAMQQLSRTFHSHKTPWLTWTPDDDTALEFRNRTAFRTYILRFDLKRRWTVTLLIRNQENTECRQFLTRDIAKMACAFHAHTGQWLGTLSEYP